MSIKCGSIFLFLSLAYLLSLMLLKIFSIVCEEKIISIISKCEGEPVNFETVITSMLILRDEHNTKLKFTLLQTHKES